MRALAILHAARNDGCKLSLSDDEELIIEHSDASEKWDASIKEFRDAITQALVDEKLEPPDDVVLQDDLTDRPKTSVATLILEMVKDVEVWHTPGQGAGYCSIQVDGHQEHWPIRSSTVGRWLKQLYYSRTEKAPNAQALQDVIGVLEGRAFFEGDEHDVWIRRAGTDQCIYIDLCNDAWQVVEIDANGWRVLDSCPVRFRRKKAMSPLPTPEPGGDLSLLRQFINVSDSEWPLVTGWLVTAFRPTGPYPILALHGEQGSAKSTTARTLRELIDPNLAPIRSEPKDPRDLMIAGNNGLIIALDNLSYVPPWLSDALCRLSTGGGFATRTLYENDEETIFNSTLPVILTGIEELANRSDLMDRCLLLQLPRITEDKRRAESEHWKLFDEKKRLIFGAILTALSAAIRRAPTTKIEKLPRMADFAIWATAAEEACGLKPGEFLECYEANRRSANESAIESSPVASAVLKLALEGGHWSGTATELLDALSQIAGESAARAKGWPKSPKALTGILRRLSPNLLAKGLDVEFVRGKKRTVSLTRKDTFSCVDSDVCDADPEKQVRNDDARATQATQDEILATPEKPLFSCTGDANDASDAKKHPLSGGTRGVVI